MRVFRDEIGVYGKCYRAKCGEYEFISSLPTERRRREDKVFKPSHFTQELIEPPVEVLLDLYKQYQLSKADVQSAQIKYSPKRNVLHMPIKDIRGYDIGSQTKVLNKDTQYPKNMTYYSHDATKAHFVWPATGRNYGTIVIVEDILSATKVGKILPCCALLSHTITDDTASLLATNFKTMIVLLDPDATKEAIRIKRKYSLYFSNLYIIVLEADPKDTDFEELQNKLNFFIK